MKELKTGRMEVLQGGDGWTNYAGSCGAAVATIGLWGATPVTLFMGATYIGVCALLLPVAVASGYGKN